MGGAYLLRNLWEKLGIPRLMEGCLKDRSFSAPVEWALFAMVTNRALDPDSKRGVEEWVKGDVALGNPEPIALQHLYRAMDVLLEQRELIHKEVFFSVADLLNLEVDLLFFDTTSTYIERDEEGLVRYGHSKDGRPDLPQIVIGLAVTKEGIPVRSWVNTQDVLTVETVKRDLAGWKLSRFRPGGRPGHELGRRTGAYCKPREATTSWGRSSGTIRRSIRKCSPERGATG